MKSSVVALAVVLVAMTTLSVTTPQVEANHSKRLVYPSMQAEQWIPVVAGFKVVPNPLQCDTGLAAGTPLFESSFEGAQALQLEDSLTFHPPGWYTTNLWHGTTFTGRGTDGGHDGAGKLYFGNDATGNFRIGGRVGGAVAFEVDIPTGAPHYVTFNTKWQGEWFEGYDHMWVEIQPGDGKTYILCTLNPEGRGDSSSNDSTASACSPYRAGPCWGDARNLNNLLLGLYNQLDPAAPHWESRYVQIPPQFNGNTVKVRFVFDSADGVANAYLGWMLDDVKITDVVVPTPPDLHPLGQTVPLPPL